MASFYLDHNVARRVALLLRAAGHVAVTTRELGGERSADAVQLLAAATRGDTFMTHDDDFLHIHRDWMHRSRVLRTISAHAGILLIPASPIWDAERTVREVEALLQEDLILESALYEWTRGGWIQQ